MKSFKAQILEAFHSRKWSKREYADLNHAQGQQLTKADQNTIADLDKEISVDIDEIQPHNLLPLGWAKNGMTICPGDMISS
ncbi:MAG: hypothetical protein ACFB12_03315 [Leptolyngbyaceae cyanobacterium]